MALYETIDQLEAVRSLLDEVGRNLEDETTSDDLQTAEIANLSIFGSNLGKIVSDFDRDIQQNCLTNGLRLSTLHEAPPERLAELLNTIRDRSRDCVERAIRELNLESRISGSESDDITDGKKLAELLAQATPARLSEWGGAKE